MSYEKYKGVLSTFLDCFTHTLGSGLVSTFTPHHHFRSGQNGTSSATALLYTARSESLKLLVAVDGT